MKQVSFISVEDEDPDLILSFAIWHPELDDIRSLINGRRGITPSTALRLAKFFGVSPDFWMNLQLRWDLYFAQRSEDDKVMRDVCPP